MGASEDAEMKTYKWRRYTEEKKEKDVGAYLFAM